MSKRISKILGENRSAILCRLIRSLRSSSNATLAEDSFLMLYRRCDSLYEGFLEEVTYSASRKLGDYFTNLSREWVLRGYNVQEIYRLIASLRECIIPFLDRKYYHNPRSHARLRLDLEGYFISTVTLFSSIYHAVLVNTREESKIFEVIFKEAGDCIYTTDSEKRIKIVNPAMEKFLGITLSETLGKKCHELLKWKDPRRRGACREHCPLSEAFSRGEDVAYYEGLLEISRFKRRWVGITASCVRDVAGEIKEIVLDMRDINDAKEMQGRLEEEIRTFETLATSTRGIELKIPCMSEFVVTARAQAELIAKRMNFQPDRIQDIKSAVGEACDNAIEHGSSQRGVDIRYKIKGPNLIIEVEDYGPGFEPDAVGIDLPSPFIEGGRGLFLIKSLVDDAEIISRRGAGTKVLMQICRKPELKGRFKRDRSWDSEKKVCVM
jgi:serine/threonine-protein kinase RsbW